MEITYVRPDGEEARGYLAMPKEGEKAPAVVLIHEWWGLDEQTRGIADRLSQHGYQVLVPDLYEGEVARIGDTEKASSLMSKLDMDLAVAQHVQGAVNYLRQKGASRVATLGFCMGGAMAIKSAVNVEGIDASVSFYAVMPNKVADVRRIRIPFQAHCSVIDEFTPREEIDVFEGSLREGGAPYELHRYEAPHAFMNERRPDKHDPAAAQVAWERTVHFLGRVLRGGGEAASASP